MKTEVVFRGTDPSEAVEADIRRRALRLQRFDRRLVGGRVVVEGPPQHRDDRVHKGGPFRVRIELERQGPEIVVSHQHDVGHEHADVFVAVKDAFHAARREIEAARITGGDRRNEARAAGAPRAGLSASMRADPPANG